MSRTAGPALPRCNYDTAAAIAHTHATKARVEDVFGGEFPALADKMHSRTAVQNWQSRALEQV